MSEQNKDRPDREDWVRQPRDFDPDKQPERNAASEAADEWQVRALRGRTLLRDEAEAEAMLQGLDEAIAARFGEVISPALHPGTRSRRTWWLMAAACLLLLLTAWWLWPARPTAAQLYARYFTPMQNDLSVSLMGRAETDPLTQALRPYNARRYAEAVESIGNYLQTHTEPRAVRLFYGISLMETGAAQEAIAQFQELEYAGVEVHYQQAADWYLALAYLSSGQAEQAKNVLHRISDPGHPHYRQAASLLQEL